MPIKPITLVQRVIDILRLRREHPDWSHAQTAAALPEAKLSLDAIAMVLDEDSTTRATAARLVFAAPICIP
jgi:hypothetical protein